MPELSVIIPARNEVYLQKTIDNVLGNIKGDTEIIAVLDGYEPDPPIRAHPKLRLVHHPEAMGQRQSINEAARLSTAKYLMKLDGHCSTDEGFDVKLIAPYEDGTLEQNVTTIPTMFNLDVETWLPKRHKVTNYMFISSPVGEKPFRASYFDGPHTPEGMEKLRQPKGPDIDDTMCCMGPGWLLSRDYFFKTGGCDEGHGGWGQQGIEVALKAWLSGGRLVVNKRTWFAHWFRGGGGPGFPYPASGRQHEAARKYSRDLWLNDKWPLATRKLDWVINKFEPPGWELKGENMPTEQECIDWHVKNYAHVHSGRKHYPRWRGHDVSKDPSDMILYQQVIFENKPDFIVEIGTFEGGSAFFLADICEIVGNGHVISIDIKARNQPPHPRITYINGDAKDPEIVAQVKKIVGKGTVMVSQDGHHGYTQVRKELSAYCDIVTPGQYMVCEDIYQKDGTFRDPGHARDWFLGKRKDYEVVPLMDQFLVGLTKDGWLRRKA